MENKKNNSETDNTITLKLNDETNLHIAKNTDNGRHFVSFDNFENKHIYENSDGSWVYHEETDPKHDDFFNIHLKKDGSFAYSNESIPPIYRPKEELYESHKFIIEIVGLIEKIKTSIKLQEKEEIETKQPAKTNDSDEER